VYNGVVLLVSRTEPVFFMEIFFTLPPPLVMIFRFAQKAVRILGRSHATRDCQFSVTFSSFGSQRHPLRRLVIVAAHRS
jgi:hypothetical protein